MLDVFTLRQNISSCSPLCSVASKFVFKFVFLPDFGRIQTEKQFNIITEISSWKVHVYDFYSRAEKYQKTNERAQRTSEYKALSIMLFVYFIGTETYLRIFDRRKLGFERPQWSRTQNNKISLVNKHHSSN